METTDPQHHVIGETMTTLRLRAGLTQEELAHAAGVHFTEISRLENGWRNPTWETMKKLAKGLGVPCWHLVAVAERLDLERGAGGGSGAGLMK